MDTTTARTTLDDVNRLRGETRRHLDFSWFPLVLFGILTLISAGVAAIFGPPALGPFWLVAGIGGGAACGWYAERTEARVGVAGPAFPYIFVGVSLITAAMLMGIFGSESVRVAGPPLAVAVAYLGFGVLERSVGIVVTAIALGAATISITLADISQATVWIAVMFGVAFTALGAVKRRDA